jgi:MFS transporter, DHA1 family, multidrug resistance protein
LAARVARVLTLPAMTRMLPRSTTALLVGVSMSSPVGMNILTPSLPSLVEAFASDVPTVQLTMTAYMIGIATGQLVVGALSDRFGRRPVLLGGLAIMALGSFAAALAPSVGLLVAGRLLQAFGGCSGMVLTRAIVRDVYPVDRAASALGYIVMGMVLGPMFAPAIGGYLDLWVGWWASMVFVGVMGLVNLGAAHALLPETNRHRASRLDWIGLLGNFATLARSRNFVGYALSNAFTSATFFCFIGAAPYLAINTLHATPSQYGLAFIGVAGGYGLGSFLAGRLSMRLGGRRMNIIGLTLASCAAALFAALGLLVPLSMPTLFAPIALMGIGQGINTPNAVAGAVGTFPRIAGAASGLLGFMHMTMGGLAMLLMGWTVTDSVTPVVIAIIAAQALAVVTYLIIRKPPDGDASPART